MNDNKLMNDMGLHEADDVVRATREAIARAKRRGDQEVTPDDLLIGLLHAVARFGISLIGPWTIDLEALDEAPVEEAASGGGPKVAYAPATAALFDRAAGIARQDGASKVKLVHLLVAYASEDGGFMGRMKQSYGFSATEWRAALARWQPLRPNGVGSGASIDAGSQRKASVQERALLSPDEAAAFLGVHTQTVRGYIRAGKLPAHRLAGERALRIRREDLLALLEPFIPDEAGPSRK